MKPTAANTMKNLIVKLLPALLAVSYLNLVSTAAAVTPAAPEFEATAYLVLDAQSGAYLVEHNADQRVEPASLTKIMTSYVAADQLAAGHIAMTDQVTVSEKAWRMGGSRMFIEVGAQVSVADLLNGVIIQSGNDASVALAEHISGTEEAFADLMNRHAAKLGMENTHFTNSSGWPDNNHYTTARDLAILSRALVREHPEIYALHSVREFTYNDIKQANRNRLLWSKTGVDGIKTGYTENAGYCLVAAAMRDGRRLISAVIGSAGPKARTKATQALLSYGYRYFETRTLYGNSEAVTNIKVWKGTRDRLNLVVAEELVLTLQRGQFEQLKINMTMVENPAAPIAAGQELGQLALALDEEVLATLPLTAAAAIAPGSFFVRLRDHIKMHWNSGN